MTKLLGRAACALLLLALTVVLAPTVASAATAKGLVAVYRLYNPNTGDHLYTTDANEYETLGKIGWTQEDVAWVSPDESSTPVYRLYNPNTGDHLYTTDANEYKVLGMIGWTQEEIAWWGSVQKDVTVYRLYNSNSGDHLYTKDSNEYSVLGKIGWTQENIAWYGIDPDASSDSDSAAEEEPPVLTSKTPIMGTTQVSVSDLVAYYKSTGATYPKEVYEKYGAATIEDFCKILVEEAKAEGVRAEVLFAQVTIETGNLRFGGQVKPEQCNFGGLGATDSGAGGADFSSYGKDGVRMGLRAQVQHLKAYASKEPLKNECVDPRFTYVSRGCAPLVENLGNGKWASDKFYAVNLLRVVEALV